MSFRFLLTGLAAASALAGCGGGGGGDAPEQPSTLSSINTSESSLSTSARLVNTVALTPPTTFGTLIEGFEQTSSTAPLIPSTGTTAPMGSTTSESTVLGWTYIPGAEFGGASGSLTAITDGGNRFANLEVDVACGTTSVIASPVTGCGRYVGATRTFGTSFPVTNASVARLNMKVRLSQPLLMPALRLVDASGQTLQYKMPHATMESLAGSGWAQVSVPIRWPNHWWGGASNGALQQSINGMSFLADQIELSGPRATMQIDDIRLVQDPTYGVKLSGSEALLTQGVVPSTNGRLSINALYYKVSDASARLAAEAGFSVMRVDLFWEAVERDGKFDFTMFDQVLRRLEQNGMKALFILDYGHAAYGGGSPITEEQRAAFVRYVQQATRFAQGRNVVGFEVWNEPDNAKYWKDGDPQSYSQLLKATRDAVKAIDSSRLVLNGGPSWFDLPYLQKLLATGNVAGVDAFAIHGYRGKLTSPETFAGDYKRLQYMLAARGQNVPIWMTEWGHSTAGLPTETYGGGHDTRARSWQARMVLRTILTQLALNMPHINLYSLVDGGNDPSAEEHNFGLLTTSLTIKPAYNAVKQFTHLIKGKTYQGLVADLPPMVHAMKWRGSTTSTYAVWSETATVNVNLNVPLAAQVTAWDGSTMPTSTSSSGTKTVSFNADNGPVYVTF